MKATKGIGHRDIKGDTKDCFLFGSRFSSKELAEYVMGVGADSIGMVKTNTKGLCMYNIKKHTQDCPGGSYLVLRSKPMVPRGRPLIEIGYKYNARKVLSFIFIENSGSTNSGLPYYLINLASFLVLQFSLLLVPFSYIICLHLLMRLNPTKNKADNI